MDSILKRVRSFIRNHPIFLIVALLAYTPWGTPLSAAGYKKCIDDYRIPEPADFAAFLEDGDGPTSLPISIDGRDMLPNEAITSDYVLRVGSSIYVCLKNITFVANKASKLPLLKITQNSHEGKVKLIKLRLYGGIALVDLQKVNGKIKIIKSHFSKSKSCVRLKKNAHVVVRGSTIYNCGIEKAGRGRRKDKPLRIKFSDNDIFLTEAGPLRAFTSLPFRAGSKRPRLVYEENTFYVKSEAHARRLLAMLNKDNVRCQRNRIVVLRGANVIKENACTTISSADASDKKIARRAKERLEKVDVSEWLLAKLVPPGKAKDESGGHEDDGGVVVEQPDLPIAWQPFSDNTLFADGTGWVEEASMQTACSGC